jgi:hypothetical protein
MLIISTGDKEANRTLFEEYNISSPVLLQKETEIATAYEANGTPSGYLISPEGKTASELAMGGEPLLALLADHSEFEIRNSKTAENGNARADRFRERSLARSKIKRDGLKAGTGAGFSPATPGRTWRALTPGLPGSPPSAGFFQPSLRPLRRTGPAA